MINITPLNRKTITEKYVQYLLNNMDDNSIYALAYDCIVKEKNLMSDESLSQEIQSVCSGFLNE